jgi:hypothetical protein
MGKLAESWIVPEIHQQEEKSMHLDKTRIQEIVRLHSEVAAHLKQSLDKAVRIGQLLTEQKQALGHGEFIPWLKANVPFTDRTARNYMRLYRERERLKTETVSGLKGAYALLVQVREEEAEFDPDAWREIIDQVNDTFFRDHPKYRIETDPGEIYRLMKESDDGSTSEREKVGFALWGNFHTHLCFFANYARAKGLDQVSSIVRRYLDKMAPDWINKPKRICGENCRHFPCHGA